LSVCDGATKKTEGSAPAVAPASDLQPAGSGHFGKIKFFCPELDHINKCAYSDYQREKIYLRTSAAVRKSLHRKRRTRKNTQRKKNPPRPRGRSREDLPQKAGSKKKEEKSNPGVLFHF